MLEHHPYPSAERYQAPRTMSAQIDEELRHYPEPAEFSDRIVKLRKWYARTPCLKSMHEYSKAASAIQTARAGEGNETFNFDFYTGTVLAVHMNAATAPLGLRQFILGRDFLTPLGAVHHEEDVEDIARVYITEWATGESEGWSAFLHEQTDEFQSSALRLAAHTFNGRLQTEERQYDFIVGYTFATDLIWGVGRHYRSVMPV